MKNNNLVRKIRNRSFSENPRHMINEIDAKWIINEVLDAAIDAVEQNTELLPNPNGARYDTNLSLAVGAIQSLKVE